MRYNGGRIKSPNQVIYTFGNGYSITVQFDDLWKTPQKKGAPKVTDIFVNSKKKNADKKAMDKWADKYLTAKYDLKTKTVILTLRAGAPEPPF